MARSIPPDIVGHTIAGRYLVETALGRGGMAAVYRVCDTRSGRTLALKRGRASDPKVRSRREALLKREYHTLSQLAHPRIIEVYDYGVDDNGPYYVMELLDGSDLEAAGQLAWREACALLRDIASSLDIMHSRGLIHRDVSSRNVRRTADGRAKLIDFGAMTSMGVPKDIVGTPPFMAPEALQMQILDGRVDLFSLGALAYYLLTGRHAFSARRMRELRDVWRSRPAPPSRRVPEIPAALSDLVLQLLALDRNARPQTAGEVISRLCVIAELPLEEHDTVSHAYLTVPTLVGRERALVAVRKRLLSLARGDGGTLLIEGAAGSGRSRILDACAIEAKLLGANVLRIDAGDADRGEFGAIRGLGAQLFELVPSHAHEAARLQRHMLAQVFENLADEDSGSASVPVPDRGLQIRELRDFVLALARRQRMLIAVDDFERLDELSQAVLAAIANQAERNPLIIAVAIDRDRDDGSSPALRLLRSVCDSIALANLSAEQTETLMRSVFGDVANLPLIAGRIHALAQGNPRATIELAQHLVSKGIVRRAAGSFSLPDKLDESELPQTLAASLRARLDALGDDASELCELLCIADGDALVLDDYAELTARGDARRVFAALDELLAARVLVADAERYRFSQPGFLPVIAERTPPSRAANAHARIERLLERTGGDLLRRAHHLFGSGAELAAVTLICSIDLAHCPAPVPLLVRAVAAAERLGCAARMAHKLRMGLLYEAQATLDVDCFLAHVRPALEQLERDSSLALYRELEGLAAHERMTQAIARTHERYLATPEHDRVLSITEAIPELARLCGLVSGIGMFSFDLQFLESFPSLEPLEPLSPALGVVSRFLDAGKEQVLGRLDRSHEIFQQLLVRIAEPDRAGLQDVQHTRVRLGLHLLLGLSDAALSNEHARTHAEVLEASRAQRVSAWRVRQILHLSRGDNAEARRCMRRAELSQLQEGGEQHGVGSTVAVEMLVSALEGDVLTLRAAIERVRQIAQRHAQWRPVWIFGQARLQRMQGDIAGALDTLMPAIELAPPLRHWTFRLVAAERVELLTELGRIDEAVALGRESVALCRREQLSDQDGILSIALAQALTCAGEKAEGVELVDQAIAMLLGNGRTGIALGAAWEARARIALRMGDGAGFDHALERCAEIYGRHRNPALAARLARLLAEAQTAEGVSIAPPRPELLSLTTDASESEYETIQSRMRECVDPSDRARCALTIMLQHMESFAGYLYAVGEDGLRLLAGLPDPQPDAELDGWIREWTEAELAEPELITRADDEPQTEQARPPLRHTDGDGRTFEPIILSATVQAEERVAAILVLHVPLGEVRKSDPAQRQLLKRMAENLLEHGDVDGLVIEDDETVTGG